MSLSVIIPALNEERQIGATLASLGAAPETEIIVVDGGSRDATVRLAAAAGARVLRSLPGRGRQQNRGAAVAGGDLLFFLHADTLAPSDYAACIRRALHLPGVCAGAFRLAIDGARPGLNLITRIANLRSHWLQLPYGDQGLFLSADLFFKLGGFPDLPLMEDFALVRELRRHGRVITLPEAVLTSGRRWRDQGIWRTTLINQIMVFGYYLGVAPATLARLYRQTPPQAQKNFLQLQLPRIEEWHLI